MLSESWCGGYQLATVWRAVGHGGYQVSSVGTVRVEVHGGGASKELEYEGGVTKRPEPRTEFEYPCRVCLCVLAVSAA